MPARFDDVWQITEIGYNPLPATDAAYGIADDNDIRSQKHQGEGYRRNTPVLYYAFDPSFSDYFGSNGEYAAQQAFDMSQWRLQWPDQCAIVSKFTEQRRFGRYQRLSGHPLERDQ